MQTSCASLGLLMTFSSLLQPPAIYGYGPISTGLQMGMSSPVSAVLLH